MSYQDEGAEPVIDNPVAHLHSLALHEVNEHSSQTSALFLTCPVRDPPSTVIIDQEISFKYDFVDVAFMKKFPRGSYLNVFNEAVKKRVLVCLTGNYYMNDGLGRFESYINC